MADDILKNIPLPADLPENWTSQQTVAPTGEEVGMDEQHGYNYLMRQVNNAQKALKALADQRKKDLARIKYWASDDPTSPASFIGGTWEQIKDCFILAAGDTYAAGSTGGEAKHSLTKLENGPHSHEVVALGNDKWYYKTSNPVGIKFQTQYHTLINDISIVSTADESAGYLATNSSGTGQPHNNMPPYTATYIWHRVE